MKRIRRMTVCTGASLLLLVLTRSEFVKTRCVRLSEFRSALRFSDPAPFCPDDQPDDHRENKPTFVGDANVLGFGASAQAPDAPAPGVAIQAVFNGAVVGGSFTGVEHNYAMGTVASAPFSPPLLEGSRRRRRVTESGAVKLRIASAPIVRRAGSDRRA